MCSILAILDLPGDAEEYRARALRLSRLQRHRGPDWSGVDVGLGGVLVHERLAIVDPASGAQPLYGPGKRTVLAVNGEIYNHRELRKTLSDPYPFRTESDCEIVLALYGELGEGLLGKISGIYAFVLRDLTNGTWMVARDPIGVVPLYLGWDDQGILHVASEMKALVPVCTTVRQFPPGHVLTSGDAEPRRYYEATLDLVRECCGRAGPQISASPDARTRSPRTAHERRAIRSLAIRRARLFGYGRHCRALRARASRGRRYVRGLVAAVALLRGGAEGLTGHGRRGARGCVPRYRTPRFRLHNSRGPGCGTGRHLSLGDV